MPYNGSGTFSVVYTFIPNTTISSTQMNGQFTDIASGLTNCLTKDGQSIMTGQVKAANGTELLPAYTFGTDLDTGFYRIAANNIGLSIGGSKLLDFSASALALTGNLSISGTLAVTGAFSPSVMSGTISGTPTFSGAVVFSGNPSFTGTPVFTGANLGTGTYSGNATLSGNLTFSGTPVFSGANLGTGTYSGAATFSGATTFSNAAGVSSKNTAKAYGFATISGSVLTQRDAFNLTIARSSDGIYVFTFSAPFASQYYTAVPSIEYSGTSVRTVQTTDRGTNSVTVYVRDGGGSLIDPLGVGLVVFQD